MRNAIMCAAVVVGLMASVALAKRDADVDKAIKAEYPDAQTQVTNVREVNGVKVSFVHITTKDGEANAEVTEYGDFLNYGLPRAKQGPYMNVVQANTQDLFKTPPQNVEVLRCTNYVVDLPGTNGKSYQARFDAVGRLQDLTNSRQIEQELSEEKQTPASGADAQAAQKFAQQYFPDIKVEGVYKSNVGDNVYNVKTTTGNVAVSSTGQLYSVREMIPNNELPKPVADAVNALFKAEKINKVYRTEWEYYQFQETTPGGEPVTISMRTNGDVLKVSTPHEEQEMATLSAHKEEAAKKNAAKHKKAAE